jgi:DNA-binding NarL/FixJ family response regulator
MAGHRPLRVLVAGGDPRILQALEELLSEAEGVDVVAAVTDGAEALRLAAEHDPAVVVVDAELPGSDGVDVARTIRREPARAQVVVLSGSESGQAAIEAFRAGALGFVPKESVGKDLVDAVRMAARSEAMLTPAVASHLVRSMHATAVERELTEREIEVMRLVAEGRTNDQIARAVGTSVSTVKAQLSALFLKLAARDRASAVAACFRSGILR